MLVKEDLLDRLPRINKSRIAEPAKFWALYATSFYEHFFAKIDNHRSLKAAYYSRVRELSSREAIKALDFFYRIRRDELDGIPIWESKLFESPDMIEARNIQDVIPGKNSLHIDDFQFPFGYYDNKMRIGKVKDIHPRMKDEYPDMKQKEDASGFSRKRLDFSGRIWPSERVISFWDYPKNKNDLYKVLKDIEKEFVRKYKKPITIMPDRWFIEIIDKRLEGDNFDDLFQDWGDAADALLIPADEYKGSGEWSAKEKAKSHIESPLKKRKQYIPGGGGSIKYNKEKPLAWRQAMYAESYYPSFKEFLK